MKGERIMFNPQIQNNIRFNAIAFKQGQNQPINSELSAQTKPDSFVKSQDVKSTKPSDKKPFYATLSDKQIKEVNETKKLPGNLRFVYVDTQMARSGEAWREPYYMVTNPLPFLEKGTANLPEGYEVVKSSLGHIKAIKIEKS